ncbi:sodium ion-translocating decarboxylase, beta subunit [Longilinea arvoryzae]|uniref:Sodium ion-translocating decarboxylase, beta subunit n=1 Tax=Longilinea arvoryzae TaxID=360412 RepID=A0A0S7BJ47_9CHLR|nr:sodium ion-translocating decarboxylase subunit beta [Longilinea arvoryzae]GAP15657.1 sodium ion-translocating decarboxylase, beta subunit [Longilinea arvoryzae]
MDFTQVIQFLTKGFTDFTWADGVMIIIGCLLIYLAIAKEIEPVLLLPIGIGCVFANLGMSAYQEGGWLKVIYDAGIKTELFPLLIFVGVGAMIDFRPLLAMPKMALLGAAGQFGIYGTLLLAILLGFTIPQAASIGVIGAIDGPTAIFVTTKLAPDMLGPVAVAAYSYMSLIPIIQPPIMRLLTTKRERQIKMEYAPIPVSKMAVVLFPIVVTVVISLIAPDAAPLIASLMLGNLIKESGVIDRLSKSVQNEIINVSTLFLGLAIGATMTSEKFLFNAAAPAGQQIQYQTLMILGLGLLAFVIDTIAGLLFGKLMCVMSGHKINPLIGACGISAFPMAGRLAAKMAQDEDYTNFILMHAMGSNTAGQLGSVIAGGLLLALVRGLGFG